MPYKILIADDSKSFITILSYILRSEEYELFKASDGKQAIDTCFRVLPDIVLLDIQMPFYDGYQVCKIIKNDELTKDIPVIFLSARAKVEDKIKGLELGAADYITKPFNKGEVLARVKTQLKIRHLTKSLIEANKKLRERQKLLNDDLKAAANIQKSLIPKKAPEADNFNFAWRFIPCEQIGGDIFNIHYIDESHLAIYIVDVSGHGVPSAMVTVSVSQSLLPDSSTVINKKSSSKYEIIPPAEVLKILDDEYPIERFDKFFTITYLILNVKTGHISYSSAAHPMPVFLKSSGEIELLESGGTIIGLGGILPFEQGEIWMQKGDRLFLYTDGIVEYVNEVNQAYGEKKFYNVLLKNKNTALDVTCNNVIKSLIEYGGHVKPKDDITLFAIECGGINEA